jgi:hypothetical protein
MSNTDGGRFMKLVESRGPSNTGNGNPPGGDDLERRIELLEKAIPDIRERLVRVETKVDHVEKTMATKTDIAELKASIAEGFNTQTKWFVGTAFAMTGLAASISFGLARLLS